MVNPFLPVIVVDDAARRGARPPGRPAARGTPGRAGPPAGRAARGGGGRSPAGTPMRHAVRAVAGDRRGVRPVAEPVAVDARRSRPPAPGAPAVLPGRPARRRRGGGRPRLLAAIGPLLLVRRLRDAAVRGHRSGRPVPVENPLAAAAAGGPDASSRRSPIRPWVLGVAVGAAAVVVRRHRAVGEERRRYALVHLARLCCCRRAAPGELARRPSGGSPRWPSGPRWPIAVAVVDAAPPPVRPRRGHQPRVGARPARRVAVRGVRQRRGAGLRAGRRRRCRGRPAWSPPSSWRLWPGRCCRACAPGSTG